MQKSTEVDLRTWLGNILKAEDLKDMTELNKSGRYWKLGFRDEAKAKFISMTYKDKEHDGQSFKPFLMDL